MKKNKKKIIVIFILGLLLGFGFGFLVGFGEGIHQTIEAAVQIIPIFAKVEINETTLNDALFRYKNHLITDLRPK